MAVRFLPTGQLNISEDPTLLPANVTDKQEISGAMIRCKNLTLDDKGKAKTRRGSGKINTTAVDELIAHTLTEMEGDRYLFAGRKIYQNEVAIETALAEADWRTFLYKVRNSTENCIFALNGTERKRITGSNVSEWGIDAPEAEPVLNAIDYTITYDWESDDLPAGSSYIKFTETREAEIDSSVWVERTLEVSADFWLAAGAYDNTLAHSVDGLSWSGLGTNIFSIQGRGCAWNGQIFVAVGKGTNTIAYSTDGTAWTGLGTSTFSSEGLGIAWNGSMFVAVGQGGNSIAYSPDGKNWTGLGTGTFSVWGNGIAWNGTRWVAVGHGVNSIAYSSDGINWTGLGSGVFTEGNGIAWGGDKFVAVGRGSNSIAYSSDGINWTGTTGTSIFTFEGEGVAWNGSLFVAVGGYGNDRAYSSDGINWTGIATQTIFDDTCHSVAWNGTLWVVGGNLKTHSLASSTDGVNWTGRSGIFNGTAFGICSAPAPKLVPPQRAIISEINLGDIETVVNIEEIEYIYGWELYYSNFQEVNDYLDITTDDNYGTYYFETATLTDERKVKYTYCRKNDDDVLEAESNPSPEATTESEPSSGLNVTWETPEDQQVTHVRIYRTLPNGATFYYDSEYAVSDISANITTLDTALGSEVVTNHNRPPEGLSTNGPTFNGYCFISNGNQLHYCLANQPEYWPADYYIEVGPPQFELKAITFYNGIVFVMNRHELFLIQGSGADSFFPFPVSHSRGALSQETVLSVKGKGIYRVHTDGIWLYTETEDKRITDGTFSPIFNGESKGTIPAINQDYIENSWLAYHKNKLYFGYPDSDATHPNNILVMRLDTNQVAHYDYSKTFMSITVDKTNDRILAVDNEGFVWEIENVKFADDNGTDIDWEIESKAFSDALRAYFPRSAKYDVEFDSTASATGEILLNDAVIQSHTLSSRETRKRLIDGNNGDRIGIRISGSGVASFRQVEVE